MSAPFRESIWMQVNQRKLNEINHRLETYKLMSNDGALSADEIMWAIKSMGIEIQRLEKLCVDLRKENADLKAKIVILETPHEPVKGKK